MRLMAAMAMRLSMSVIIRITMIAMMGVIIMMGIMTPARRTRKARAFHRRSGHAGMCRRSMGGLTPGFCAGSACGFALGRHRSHRRFDFGRIAQIATAERAQIIVKLVHQRAGCGDVHVDDIGLRNIVQVLHQGPQ